MVFIISISFHRALTCIKYHGHMLLEKDDSQNEHILFPSTKLNNDSKSFRPVQFESINHFPTSTLCP